MNDPKLFGQKRYIVIGQGFYHMRYMVTMEVNHPYQNRLQNIPTNDDIFMNHMYEMILSP